MTATGVGTVGLVTVVTLVSGIIVILKHFRYVPRFVEFVRNPGRALTVHREIRERYYFKKFWRPVVQDDELIVVIPSEDVDDLREGTAKYDHVGVNKLTAALKSNFRNLDIRYVPDNQFDSSDDGRSNVLCASGPIPNDVTRSLLYQPHIPYRFEQLQTGQAINTITRRDSDFRLEPEMEYDEERDEHVLQQDYGIITKARYKGDRVIINAAGGFGEGTLAGFEILQDPSKLARLDDAGEYFQALYTVSVADGEIQEPVFYEQVDDEGETPIELY